MDREVRGADTLGGGLLNLVPLATVARVQGEANPGADLNPGATGDLDRQDREERRIGTPGQEGGGTNSGAVHRMFGRQAARGIDGGGHEPPPRRA